jgi:hypothetical protein
MDSEMELASRCPAEIPCQFNHKRVENSVQKGTTIQAQREYVLRRRPEYFLDGGGRGGSPQPLMQSNAYRFPTSFSPEGARLAFSELTPGGGAETRIVPVESESLQLAGKRASHGSGVSAGSGRIVGHSYRGRRMHTILRVPHHPLTTTPRSLARTVRETVPGIVVPVTPAIPLALW